MSDATSSTTPLPEGPEWQPEPAPKRSRAARLRGWASGQEKRIAAGVAAVALVGAGAVVVSVAHEGMARGHHGALDRAGDGPVGKGPWSHGGQGGNGRGENRRGDEGGSHDHGDRGGDEHRAGAGRHHGGGQGEGRGDRPGADAGRPAPAPLPSLAASAALDKAQAAVPGGRAESLNRVTAQGGSAAWAVVVVGPDGVRHRVTVDGTSGELTGNTVVDGSGR
ncbi:hypothetical protein ACIRS1_13895 [Kitasatospora sp. NPDC101176]|uniref:hypothetical protein n=1 Tax=Kitasatospora sp. NPDC101176 TaxID=3364099 RepID=UPI00382F411A